MPFGSNDQGGLPGSGRPRHGDGDPGGNHRLEKPRRDGVEGVPLDQVAELETPPGEGADGDQRAIGGERGKDCVEPLTARQAGVDPRA
jgi:hypothetical protein